MKTLIKAARDLLGMTQAELCEKANVPLITLRQIEERPITEGWCRRKRWSIYKPPWRPRASIP